MASVETLCADATKFLTNSVCKWSSWLQIKIQVQRHVHKNM